MLASKSKARGRKLKRGEARATRPATQVVADAHPLGTYPTVRHAQLLLSQNVATGAARPFSYKEGEKAVEAIVADLGVFHHAIQVGLQKAIAEFGFDSEGSVGTHAPDLHLRGPSRSPSLGAVYDFQEFVIDLNGVWTILCRVCLTVCVQEDFLGDGDDLIDKPAHSKAWVRFILVRHPNGSRAVRAVETPDEHIAKFAEFSERMAKSVIAEVVKPYQKVVTTVAGAKMKVEKKQRLSFFAVGVSAGAFAATEQLLSEGYSLARCVTEKDSIAAYLARLAAIVLAERAKGQLQFLAYRNPQGDAGLFLGSTERDHACFFGVARETHDHRDDVWSNAKPGKLSSSAANVVTAGMSMEYGARF